MKDLVIKINGEIEKSNFDAWKKDLIKQIQAANKPLESDKDFAEAEGTVKALKGAEKALVEAKADALEQAADIQKLFGAIDEISEEARDARLSLDKQIKTRKEEIKEDLIGHHMGELQAHIDNYDVEFQRAFDYLCTPDGMHMRSAIKGKRTVSTINLALAQYVEDIIGGIDEKHALYTSNQERLEDVDEQYQALFQDKSALLVMSTDALTSEIGKRIAVHEANEAQRKLAEEKAKREAEEKARQEAEQAAQATTTPAPVPTPAPTPEPAAQQTTAAPETPELASNFVVMVEIMATRGKAVEIAQHVHDLLEDDLQVTAVRLTRKAGEAA